MNGDLTLNSKNPLYGHLQVVGGDLSALLAGSATYPDTVFRQNSLLGVAYPDSTIQACLVLTDDNQDTDTDQKKTHFIYPKKNRSQ